MKLCWKLHFFAFFVITFGSPSKRLIWCMWKLRIIRANDKKRHFLGGSLSKSYIKSIWWMRKADTRVLCFIMDIFTLLLSFSNVFFVMFAEKSRRQKRKGEKRMWKKWRQRTKNVKFKYSNPINSISSELKENFTSRCIQTDKTSAPRLLFD